MGSLKDVKIGDAEALNRNIQDIVDEEFDNVLTQLESKGFKNPSWENLVSILSTYNSEIKVRLHELPLKWIEVRDPEARGRVDPVTGKAIYDEDITTPQEKLVRVIELLKAMNDLGFNAKLVIEAQTVSNERNN